MKEIELFNILEEIEYQMIEAEHDEYIKLKDQLDNLMLTLEQEGLEI